MGVQEAPDAPVRVTGLLTTCPAPQYFRAFTKDFTVGENFKGEDQCPSIALSVGQSHSGSWGLCLCASLVGGWGLLEACAAWGPLSAFRAHQAYL